MVSARPSERFHRLSRALVERFGEKVHKVSLRGGFTCPNRDGTLGSGGCAFCAGDALAPVGWQPGQTIAEQLDAGIAYIRARHGARRFIAYFQDYSATYAPADRLAAIYAPALDRPGVVGLAVGTRPDCLPAATVDLLAGIARQRLVWVELGLQLASDAILDRLNRGHTTADFVRAVTTLRASGLDVCAHVILGLPDATPEDELRTADLLAGLGIQGIKLHAFHVLVGTPLAEALQRGELTLQSREAHADRVVSFLERLPAEVVVHRVTGEAPPRLTLAPAWTVNKLAAFDAVVAAFVARDTWQGRSLGAPRPT
jgi:hypothetical protein